MDVLEDMPHTMYQQLITQRKSVITNFYVLGLIKVCNESSLKNYFYCYDLQYEIKNRFDSEPGSFSAS